MRDIESVRRRHTITVTHVLRHTDSCDLHNLHHISLLTPDLTRRKLLHDTGVPENGTIALCLGQVLQETDHAVFDLDVCLWF